MLKKKSQEDDWSLVSSERRQVFSESQRATDSVSTVLTTERSQFMSQSVLTEQLCQEVWICDQPVMSVWIQNVRVGSEYSEVNSFRIYWFDLVTVWGALTSLLQSHNSSVLSLLYSPALTPIHDYWKNHSFDYRDLCQQSDVFAFYCAVQVCHSWRRE